MKKLFKRFKDFLDYEATFHEENGIVWHITSNKGIIQVDMESLLKSENFKRQIAAVKRLELENSKKEKYSNA